MRHYPALSKIMGSNISQTFSGKVTWCLMIPATINIAKPNKSIQDLATL